MPTALIIGAGGITGRAIAGTFLNAGYSIAAASRSNKLGSQSKHFPSQASKLETMPSIFAQVKETLGALSVVVYNAYHDSMTKPNEPFDTPLDTFTGILFNGTVVPGFMTFGMAKAAGAHLIQYLVLMAFEGKPFK